MSTPSSAVRIWVDADACPGIIKDILYRAADRVGMMLILVVNMPLRVPPSPHIRTIQVPSGADEADARIAAELAPGDLVITADIPLASKVIKRGGHALNPRGLRYTADNIAEQLSMRDFMDSLRSSGVETGGPAPLGNRDRQAFANELDRWLNQ